MSDAMNAVVNADPATVVVSEGIARTLGEKVAAGKPGRKARMIPAKPLQEAINRAEANGPLPNLGQLYAAVAADETWNVFGLEVASVTRNIKNMVAAGLVTHQTSKGKAGRAKGDPKPKEKVVYSPLTDDDVKKYTELLSAIADKSRLEKLMAGSRAAKPGAITFLRKLNWLRTAETVKA